MPDAAQRQLKDTWSVQYCLAAADGLYLTAYCSATATRRRAEKHRFCYCSCYVALYCSTNIGTIPYWFYKKHINRTELSCLYRLCKPFSQSNITALKYYYDPYCLFNWFQLTKNGSNRPICADSFSRFQKLISFLLLSVNLVTIQLLRPKMP